MLECPSQSSDLNLTENLGQDLKVDVYSLCPTNLREQRLFCFRILKAVGDTTSSYMVLQSVNSEGVNTNADHCVQMF